MRESFEITTTGRGAIEITDRVASLVRRSEIEDGLCTVFCHHTSASLILCENADSTVLDDLETWMGRAVADGDRIFRHRAEGPDDMAAHVRSILTCSSLGIPVADGRLDVGTWQGVFLWEHRHRGHRRRISVLATPA